MKSLQQRTQIQANSKTYVIYIPSPRPHPFFSFVLILERNFIFLIYLNLFVHLGYAEQFLHIFPGVIDLI